MEAYKVMRKVVELSVVQKRDIFLWHDERGLFNCTVSVHCGNHEREVFEVLRELPQPERMNWRSYKADKTVGFTCLEMRFGNYETGIVDVEVYIHDVQ